MTVSFQTNTLKSRRKAIIDGREYTVRRYGNIERMELLRLQDLINDVYSKYPKDTADKDISDADAKKISDYAMEMSEMLIKLFDDGTDEQKYSRELVSSLDEEDVYDLMDSIFEQTEPSKEKK